MNNNDCSDKKKNLKWFIDKLMNLFLIICGVVLFWVLLQITSIASFKIPSDSMEPVLIAGDNILVNKCVMGGRLFNIWDALEDKEINIYRLPSLGKIKRNDVVVFNFPYLEQRWDSIAFRVMKYYVKRCVALPGDTFEIKRGHYKVHGCTSALGNVEAQDRLMQIIERGREGDYGIVMSGYPYSDIVNWNIVSFGPLYLPAKGDVIEMSSKHVALYRNAIEWEQKKKLFLRGDTILLNDSVIRTYRFKENYYFVAGDKVMNSQDSRYWGLLPERFIVGKAVRIWKSVDRETDKIRWNRIFKKIHSLHKSLFYNESNKYLEEACWHSTDPMVLNIMGKNYQELHNYEQAENLFKRAIHRLPGRIYPYYLLTNLYAEPDFYNPGKLKEVADIVLTKEPKVHSTAIKEMRSKVREILEKINMK